MGFLRLAKPRRVVVQTREIGARAVGLMSADDETM
jgi:hypothetical protein